MLLAISMKQAIGESFWQKESLTLLQGSKDPVLPTLINTKKNLLYFILFCGFWPPPHQYKLKNWKFWGVFNDPYCCGLFWPCTVMKRGQHVQKNVLTVYEFCIQESIQVYYQPHQFWFWGKIWDPRILGLITKAQKMHIWSLNCCFCSLITNEFL